jgi:hypothetical protein
VLPGGELQYSTHRPELVGIVFVVGWLVGIVVDPEVRSAGALVARPDPIVPIVAVGEAAAGIADNRSFDLAHVIDNSFADAVYVRNLGVLANPKPVINDAAEVFGKVAVNVRRDRSQWLVDKDLDVRISSARLRGGGQTGKT